MLRKVFRANVQSNQLDLKRYSAASVASIYCQKTIGIVTAFSPNYLTYRVVEAVVDYS